MSQRWSKIAEIAVSIPLMVYGIYLGWGMTGLLLCLLITVVSCGVYRRWEVILDWLIACPYRCWLQIQQLYETRQLSMRKDQAEQNVHGFTVNDDNGENVNAERRMRTRIRQMRELKTVEDVTNWEERRRETLEDARAKAKRHEQQQGPNRRSDARQKVRLFYTEHSELLNTHFDRTSVESYISKAMHDGIPSKQVERAGTQLIEHFERQLAIDEVWTSFKENRDCFTNTEFDEAWVRQYVRDMGARRSVDAVRDARDKLLRQFEYFKIVSSDEPVAVAGARDDDLWAAAEQFVDSQIKDWKLEKTDEERLDLIQQRYEHLKNQED